MMAENPETTEKVTETTVEKPVLRDPAEEKRVVTNPVEKTTVTETSTETPVND